MDKPDSRLFVIGETSSTAGVLYSRTNEEQQYRLMH
jgi:hypothetical protein